jgi:hypothetical protein
MLRFSSPLSPRALGDDSLTLQKHARLVASEQTCHGSHHDDAQIRMVVAAAAERARLCV